MRNLSCSCLTFLASVVTFAIFLYPVYLLADDPGWDRVCKATQDSNVGTGHPNFCVCSEDCLERGTSGPIACGVHNEVLVTVNGQTACACPCASID
jgi:hypothetical protein